MQPQLIDPIKNEESERSLDGNTSVDLFPESLSPGEAKEAVVSAEKQDLKGSLGPS